MDGYLLRMKRVNGYCGDIYHVEGQVKSLDHKRGSECEHDDRPPPSARHN